MTHLTVETLSLGPIGTNCYIVSPAGGMACVIVDPGDDGDVVIGHVRERGLTPEAILVTHCHWDHIGAVAPVARELSIPVYMSRIEAPVLADIQQFTPAGFGPFEPWSVEELLDGGETLELASITFETLLLPGHSPGTIGYLHRDPDGHDTLFVGDVVFAGSIGRTDLPFSDGREMASTLTRLMRDIGDDTVLLSGHGPATTMGRERRTNPFLLQLA